MSKQTPRAQGRRSIRLKGYDYRRPRAYFFTICTFQMKPIFGEVIDGVVQLNKFGQVAHGCWVQIPTHFNYVELDQYIVMPNHVFGIIVIRETDPVGAQHASPLQAPTKPGPPVGSFGAVVGSYKSAVTRRINRMRGITGARVWQRNYYENIIRDDLSLDQIRTYIRFNPSRRNMDRNRT